jgi:hypothetical protein
MRDVMEEYPENNSEQNENTPSEYSLYRKSSELAEDNKSSAVIFLVLGIAGIIFVFLGVSGVLPLKLGSPYVFYSVMSALFILFIVMGAVSFKNAKIFAGKAVSENTLQEALAKWCSENLSAESIDSEINADEYISDEELYFKRYEYIKMKLNNQFINLDQALLDNFIDDKVYSDIFDAEGHN